MQRIAGGTQSLRTTSPGPSNKGMTFSNRLVTLPNLNWHSYVTSRQDPTANGLRFTLIGKKIRL